MIPLGKIPHRIAVPVLLGLFVVCGFVSLWGDSVTFDETAHLAAGVSYWEKGDFRLNPEHPPLGKLIAAAPLVAMGRGGGDYSSSFWTGQRVAADGTRSRATQWGFGFELINGPREASARRDPAVRLVPARTAMLALGALLAYVVYLWARMLWGPSAGLLALALAVTCPTLLAHARLVTTDIGAALGFVGTSWLLWRWLVTPSWPRAFAVGLGLGAALLLKYSCVLLAPVVVVLTVLAVAGRRLDLRRAIGGVAVIAAVSWATLWAGYGFRFVASPDPGYVQDWVSFVDAEHPFTAIVFARDHKLFPEAYLFGFAYAQAESVNRVAFLDGQTSIAGWYRYFPEAFLLKTPLAFTALALWAIGAALARARRITFDGWCLLLAPAVFAGLAISSRFNIGHRHLTPIYPFLCIAIAPAASWLEARGRKAIAAAVLVAGCFVSFALATPGYLSYFNVLGGGTRGGWRHLVDSNIDWGQDLRRLSRWMAANGEHDIDLAYFGTGDPRAYGIGFRKVQMFFDFYPEMPVTRPGSGRLLAASVTFLQGVYLDSDRAFAREVVRRGLVPEAKILEYLDWGDARRMAGNAVVPTVAAWAVERGLITPEQRAQVEDGIPAIWLARVRDTLTPVGRAGDSILIYRVP